MIIRPARIADAPSIQALIRPYADQGLMVLRTLDEIYSNLREFIVCELDNQVAGCAATHIFWADWAELKCVAVHQDYLQRGVGRALCDACLQDMRKLGVKNLFALTKATSFFEKIGYSHIDKSELPRYIWGECVRCPSFPECAEEAYVIRVQTED